MAGNEYAGISEAMVRFGSFVAVFGFMGLWELLAPARDRSYARLQRWPGNLALAALNMAIVRLLFPAAGVGLAMLAEMHGAGLFRLLDLPFWFGVIAGVVTLDLAIYFQHLLFHAVPALWRLHRVHHADPDFDVTTALRFHPIEILLSMLIKATVIFAFGPPVLAVLIFEVVLNAAAGFNHANVRLPAGIEGVLRWLIVTPDMHRVHHSNDMRETNSNYGFNLSIWDRLFGTYRAQPALGHERMRIGVSGLEDPKSSVRLLGLLAQPFLSPREQVESPERHREQAIGS